MELTPETNVLKSLIPISELTDTNFKELIRQIELELLPAGKTLFERGDTDSNTIYLINGEVTLTDGAGEQKVISHRSAQCRFPLDHHHPRHQTVTAKTDIRFIRIDNKLLDVLLTWEQNAGYIVQELDDKESLEAGENDWMSKILQSQIFHNIPAANIHSMFMKMQEMTTEKDDIIMQQGDPGDYYYMIKEGQCSVIRNAPETGNRPLEIATLTAGQGFGEEALISDSPRNATVKMLSPGVLMRLSKEDFNHLLKSPLLHHLTFDEAQQRIKNGARWLDVRLMSEYQNSAIPGSINIPLYLLRLNTNKLLNNREYIVVCDTGSRSASAAFILRERGFNCFVLAGGLQNIPEGIASKIS